MNKFLPTLIVAGLTAHYSLLAQNNVAINTTGSSAHASSMLDVEATDKGLLIPRVALTSTNVAAPVTSPANSLLVYNTNTSGVAPNNVTPGYYYWDGSAWVRLATGNNNDDWDLLGNAGTNPAINYLGTSDAVDLVVRTNNIERMRVLGSGNVGIGVTNPGYGLELNGTFGYGNGIAGTYRSRTETRDNAGQIATQSGFFETSNPVNFPTGASSWWHLLDVRHSNNANNYAMQISGSFFDQELWFRKTNNNGAQAWSRLLSTSNLNSLAWSLLGNSGTNAGTNFIGTTDAVDFVTRTNNTERMRVTSGGNVGIGTGAPDNLLHVNGIAQANRLYVGASSFPAASNGTINEGFESESKGLWYGYSSTNTLNDIIGFDRTSGTFDRTLAGLGHPVSPRTGQFMLMSHNNSLNSSTSQVHFRFFMEAGGTFSAYWMVSSEAGYDFFQVSVDGGAFANLGSGASGWNLYSIALSSGYHVITFRYTKDGSVNHRNDAAFIDDVSITNARIGVGVGPSDGDIWATGNIVANSTRHIGDLAENFFINNGFAEYGDIVSIEPGNQNQLSICKSAYNPYIAGVVSEKPSVYLNNPTEGIPIGLTGRVKVKVDKNAMIRSGDFITSSNVPGVGMRLEKSGYVVGVAMEDQKPGEPYVMILLQPGRYINIHDIPTRETKIENKQTPVHIFTDPAKMD